MFGTAAYNTYCDCLDPMRMLLTAAAATSVPDAMKVVVMGGNDNNSEQHVDFAGPLAESFRVPSFTTSIRR